MSGIKQPVTQVRMTNVAVVRMKVHGHRYEVACYKNAVLGYRSGVETDLDEVLQSRHVFSNVSKGVMASAEALEADFGSRDVDAVCRAILARGELQVSEKERSHALEALGRDIAVLVAAMCVNPDTRRPYPVRMVEQGMRDCHFSIQQHKSAKSQALALIPRLQRVMPIHRAHMRVAVTCEVAEAKALKRQLVPLLQAVEEESWGTSDYRLTALLTPGNYRAVDDLIAAHSRGRAHMEIIDLNTAPKHTGEDDDGDDDSAADDDNDGDADDDDKGAAHGDGDSGGASNGASGAASAITASVDALSAPLSSLRVSPATAASASSSTSLSSRAPPKSKKAARRELAEEEIRTVGERREWEEEEGAIEDSARVRQQQQQQASKAKKERKHRAQHQQPQPAELSAELSAPSGDANTSAASDSAAENGGFGKQRPQPPRKSRRRKATGAGAAAQSTDTAAYEDAED